MTFVEDLAILRMNPSFLSDTEVDGSRQTLPTVMFVSSTLTEWPDYLPTDYFYEKICEIADAHGNLRIYPSKTETDRAHHKTGDIRALEYDCRSPAINR